MENTTNELVKLFRDRLKYPIITVYGILLIIYNWDVLAVFFLSNDDIRDRIKYIKDAYSDPYFTRIWMPLVKAIIISLLAPLTMLGLEFLQKYINKPRQKIKDARLNDSWDTKTSIALKEYQYEQAKSGSKTEQEWRSKFDEMTEQMKRMQNQHGQQMEIEHANYDLIVKSNENLNIELREVTSKLEGENRLRTIYLAENRESSDIIIELTSKIGATLGINYGILVQLLVTIDRRVESFQDLKNVLESSDFEYNKYDLEYITKKVEQLYELGIVIIEGNKSIHLSNFGSQILKNLIEPK